MRCMILAVLAVFLFAPASAQDAESTASIATVEQVSDRALKARISDILSNVDALESVTLDVDAGVITLGGSVVSEADRSRAGNIVRRVQGVVEVQDRIEVSQDISVRGQAVLERLQSRFESFLIGIPIFLIALAIFLLFLFLARFYGRHPVFVRRLSPNPFLQQLLVQTIRIGITLLGLVLALEVLDATSLIGAVLGAAGLTGVILGFALKETIENYVAGLLLSLRQPFLPNDHILVQGYEGHVVRLSSRATVLITLEGNHVRIPNADVFKTTLVNYSRSPERRFSFEVGVGVQTDLIEARNLAITTLDEMDAVLNEPPPDVWVEALGDSNVVLTVVGWIDQRTHAIAKVRGEAIRRVKVVFEAADYDLPEPIYRLNLMNSNIAGLLKEGALADAAGPPRRAPESPSDAPENLNDESVDLSRDTHLDREVAEERAENSDKDMLSPAAEQE